MSIIPFLALPPGLEIVAFSYQEGTLYVPLLSTQPFSHCPLCGSSATRIHSRYQRRLADLPSAGQPVSFLLSVRKFFCDTPTCARKIFTERLTPFVAPWARVTERLFQIVQVIGLATGGRPGVRVTDRLGIQTTRQTILRRIMALSSTSVKRVSQLGADDFSFRRGRKFGTIFVDLTTHQVIDLLPDRTTEIAAAWMGAHPEIELVSRDRGGDYAAAARKALTASKKAFSLTTWKPTPDAYAERARLSRRAQRYDRYQQVVVLEKQGFEQAEIARRVGLSTRTIQRWRKSGTFPEVRRRQKRRSIFDPYAAYVLKRWKEGCRNGSQLYREIKTKGYPGSEQMVHRFLRRLRAQLVLVQTIQASPTQVQGVVAKKAVWLFVRDPEKLDERERGTVAAICQASDTAKTLYQLVQEFRQMLHHREGAKLDDWLEKVRGSNIRELQSFVAGVEGDKAAVVAGLTLPQNNGLVEGKVNKLKLIKRMGYGRARFALLRQRVLHAL